MTRGPKKSEKVALPALVHAKVRREHLRGMDLLVTEPRLAQNVRFELELNKLLHPFSLEEDFRALFVNGDAELVFLGKEQGVRFR
jgi:hypothetical protein